MYQAYIIRTAEQVHAFYFSEGNGLCRRVYEKGRWGRPYSVAVEASQKLGFSVTRGNDGRFYVLYYGQDGAAGFVSGNAEGFRHEVVGDIKGSVYVTSKGRMCVDGISQVIKDDHLILFSSDKDGLSYKEMNFREEAEPVNIHVGGGVTRFSALVSEENVHFLYIVRSMLGARLLYRKRHKAGLSAAVTVCEGGRMEDCLLFIIKNRVYAGHMAARSLYLSISDDDGVSFRRPFKYRNKLCEQPIKAAYISESPYDENEFAAREVLVDALNPWDVQIIPDMYDNFYPSEKTPANSYEPVANSYGFSPARPASGSHAPVGPVGAPYDDNWYSPDMPDEERQRNRAETLERELAAKDRQLLSLKQEVENQRLVIEKMFNAGSQS